MQEVLYVLHLLVSESDLVAVGQEKHWLSRQFHFIPNQYNPKASLKKLPQQK